MANTFREVYKKTGTSSYQLVGNVGVGGVKLDVMKGATSSEDGEIGLVPKPTTGHQDYVLTGSGVWVEPNSIVTKNIVQESLILLSFAEYNQEKTFTTYNSRKISNYSLILFCMCDNSGNIRESSTIPRNLFTNDEPVETLYMSSVSGTQASPNYTQMAFRYINDTSFGVKRTVDGGVNYFQCIGIRIE